MKKITSFVLLVFCIAIILSTGCTDTVNEGATTSTSVPTSPIQKYSAGDIIAKDITSSSLVAVLKYDPVHDSYEIYDVTRSDSGSWNAPANPSTRILARTAVEKLYTVKIGNGASTQPTSKTNAKPESVVISQQTTSTISGTTTVLTTVVPTKDQAAIHDAVRRASLSMDLNGDISSINNPSTNNMGYVSIPVALVPGESNIDMSQTAVKFRYLNNEVSEDVIASTIKPGQTKSPTSSEISETYLGTISSATNVMSSPNWGILNKNTANSDNLLEPGEIFTLGIGVPTSVNPIDHFVIEILPPRGSSLKLDIKTPAASGSANKLGYSYL